MKVTLVIQECTNSYCSTTSLLCTSSSRTVVPKSITISTCIYSTINKQEQKHANHVHTSSIVARLCLGARHAQQIPWISAYGILHVEVVAHSLRLDRDLKISISVSASSNSSYCEERQIQNSFSSWPKLSLHITSATVTLFTHKARNSSLIVCSKLRIQFQCYL